MNIHIDELCQRFCTAIEQWMSIRETTIQEINSTIEDLTLHHRNVNYSRIAGSSVSITGSVMALAGVLMAPATGGLSLILPLGGAALALAGGGTSAGASIVDVVIENSNIKKAQQQLIHDYEQLYVISALATAIERNIEEYENQQYQGNSRAALLVQLGAALTQGIFRTGNLGVRVTELFAVAFAAVKTGGAAPARAATIALAEGIGQAAGSATGFLLGSVGEAVGNAIGGALGKVAGEVIAPKGTSIAAARAGSTVAKGLAKVGAVFNVITIPLDLIEISRSIKSLDNGSKTDAIKQLTNIVRRLEEEKQAIAQLQNEITQEGAQE